MAMFIKYIVLFMLYLRALLRSLSGLIGVTNFKAEEELLHRIPVDEYDATVV